MTFRRAALFVTAVAALAAAPTLAADIPGQQPWSAPNRVAAAWQGFYAGVHAGYVWGQSDATLTPGPTALSFKPTSFAGGLFAGMNFQVAPQFVVGGEADVSIFNLDRTLLVGGLGYTSTANWQGTLRGRAGFAFDNILIYGTAGLALTNREMSGPLGSASTTQIGYALGAGVEGKVTDNVFARVEYVFTHFGGNNFAIGGVQRINGDLDVHNFRAGVGYRF